MSIYISTRKVRHVVRKGSERIAAIREYVADSDAARTLTARHKNEGSVSAKKDLPKRTQSRYTLSSELHQVSPALATFQIRIPNLGAQKMALLLKDVLQLPLLKAARILTDPEVANHRHITSVAVIEAPVGKFIRRGEFVMSTGMDVGRNAKTLRGFVREIAEAGAATLAIAIGPHTPRVPTGNRSGEPN